MNNVIGLVNGVAVCLEEDPWRLQDAKERLCDDHLWILSQERWNQLDPSESEKHGIMLDPDDDPAVLVPVLDRLPLIALEFRSFRDGRAYSQANLLRTRYGFQGDLRAIGDVLRDQLSLMRHCGFTSFAVREDKSVRDALKGFDGYDMIYARSATTPEPLYRRRARGSHDRQKMKGSPGDA